MELYGTLLDFTDNENEIAVDEMRTEWMLKPFYNFETKEFYEGATFEEIAEYNKTLE